MIVLKNVGSFLDNSGFRDFTNALAKNAKPTFELEDQLLMGAAKLMESNAMETDMCIMTGLMRETDRLQMTRLLFRSSKGMVLSFFRDVGHETKFLGENNQQKTFFVLVFQQNETLKQRVSKICEIYANKTYVKSIPQLQHTKRIKEIDELETQLHTANALYKSSRKQLRSYLVDSQRAQIGENGHQPARHSFLSSLKSSVVDVDPLILQKIFLFHQRAIYTALNKFKSD